MYLSAEAWKEEKNLHILDNFYTKTHNLNSMRREETREKNL